MNEQKDVVTPQDQTEQRITSIRTVVIVRYP